MTLLEQLGDIATRGVDLIEEAYAAADLPLPADQARELRRTAEAFLAPTSHARYQRRALAAARRNQHSLTTLALIARRSQRVKKSHRALALPRNPLLHRRKHRRYFPRRHALAARYRPAART